MKVLMIGDVVAKPGRIAVLERIQDLREQHQIDFVVVNVENVAGGFSITPRYAKEFLRSGVDVMTSGNHIFSKTEIVDYIQHERRLLRPANYPPSTPGSGVWIGEVNGVSVAVINIMGRLFMPPVDDPFRTIDEVLSTVNEKIRVRLVDMHAEATAEKRAMGWYLDGRVSAVLGTHTHVQTADEQVLTAGTAYLTDIGMTGSYAGVLGVERSCSISRFTSVPMRRIEHSEGDVRICAAIIDIDERSGSARDIFRLSIKHQS